MSVSTGEAGFRMKRIGVTGHRSIPGEVLAHVESGLRAVLGGHEGPLEALSSLAEERTSCSPPSRWNTARG